MTYTLLLWRCSDSVTQHGEEASGSAVILHLQYLTYFWRPLPLPQEDL